MGFLQRFVIRCTLFAIPLVLVAETSQAQKSKYACSEPNPTSLCTASNTCGSASESCSVDVKRTANSASATPSVQGAKGNSTFCVKAGTTVVWKSDTKHEGFIVDMGPKTPFDTDDIIGGSDKQVTTVAKTPGCYKYSLGACLSGAIYGMCENTTAELVVVQ